MVEALPTLLDPCVVESSGELASVLGVQVEAARRCRRRAAASSTARPRRAKCHTPHEALTGRCRRPASRAHGRECGAALAVEVLRGATDAPHDRHPLHPVDSLPVRFPPRRTYCTCQHPEGVSTCRAARAISTWWPSCTRTGVNLPLPSGTVPESWRPGDAPGRTLVPSKCPATRSQSRKLTPSSRAAKATTVSTDGRCAPRRLQIPTSSHRTSGRAGSR